MTRAKGRKNAKVAVQQYTKKDGTQVREHERIVNPRFIVECGDPYCKVVSSWDYDPLLDSEQLEGIVFTHDEAEDQARFLNRCTPEELVKNLDCTLEEAQWTPGGPR